MNFYDTVVNGQLSPARIEAIMNCLAEHEGKPVVISIKRGKKRSHNQNAFYWGIVIPAIKRLFEQNGDAVSPEKVHQFLKEHVAGMVDIIVLPDGRKKAIVSTSTDLSTAEWEEYILKIRAWAGQWGVDFPEPNE